MDWTSNALQVWNARLTKPHETPEQALDRVSQAIFPDLPDHARRLYDRMTDRKFFPNSPAIRNLGDPEMPGLPHACFVLDPQDSITSIFDTIKYAALVHQAGGGTGFCFSGLRPAGSQVRSTKGIASGPCSFIDVYDAATDKIKQGSQRRGANMATFSIYHPDVAEFIQAKQDLRRWQNFNVSVMVDGTFFRAVDQDLYICQTFPVRPGRAFEDPYCGHDGVHARARDLFDLIVTCAWTTGEPGVLFQDLANAKNPHPELYTLSATNPCAEQWLGPYESCVLGSINLARYIVGGCIDWANLNQDVFLYTYALDRMIDVAHYPIPEIELATKRTRRIGLGVMGWADMLYQLRIPYDSNEALELATYLGNALKGQARQASVGIALSEGPYPANKAHPALRNAARTTIAPTGTLSLLADCTGGIEPMFAPATLRQHDPALFSTMTEIKDVDPSVPWARFAYDVSPEWRVRMQAAWQKSFSDNAISGTINVPEHTPIDDVGQSIRLAYELGCLGWTYYRDNSRPGQVLNVLSDCSGPACSIEGEINVAAA